MLSNKPTKLTLTLVFYITFALILSTSSVDAKGYAQVPGKRDHGSLNRILRKRAPAPQATESATKDNSNLAGIFGGAANGAAADPPTSSASAGTATTTDTKAATQTSTSATATTAPTTSATTSASDILSGILNPATSSSSASSSSVTSSSSSSTSSSTSSTTTSSSTSSTPSSTSVATTSAPASVVEATGNSIVTLTSSVSAASATSSGQAASTSSHITRTTITVLIVIAASVGGVAIIWTVIRKWKFKPSSSFEDRMQPIDWQPTTEDSGLPVHRRNSNASSFHSGSGHASQENMAGRGGYGATSEDAHTLPDHDFTAGPAHLAPVGGYADLARGPSPQPQMQDLSRGPSLTRPNFDQYGVPLHHQGGYEAGAYDYNSGGPRY